MQEIKIGVLADTHINSWKDLSPTLISGLRDLDLIVHAGDFIARELLDNLKQLGNFIGIAGNHDGPELRRCLPEMDILEINGRRIGLHHGHGLIWPLGIQNGLRRLFSKEKLNAIIYGHTHIATAKQSRGIFFFNPGSAACKWPSLWQSYGIMTVGEAIRGEIRFLYPSITGLFHRNQVPALLTPDTLKSANEVI